MFKRLELPSLLVSSFFSVVVWQLESCLLAHGLVLSIKQVLYTVVEADANQKLSF
jgi:hypothetical protein